METLDNIMEQIAVLTNKIESNYPELYIFLDEEPITIPSSKHPKITVPIMQEYLENLKSQIKHFQETRKND